MVVKTRSATKKERHDSSHDVSSAVRKLHFDAPKTPFRNCKTKNPYSAVNAGETLGSAMTKAKTHGVSSGTKDVIFDAPKTPFRECKAKHPYSVANGGECVSATAATKTPSVVTRNDDKPPKTASTKQKKSLVRTSKPPMTPSHEDCVGEKASSATLTTLAKVTTMAVVKAPRRPNAYPMSPTPEKMKAPLVAKKIEMALEEEKNTPARYYISDKLATTKTPSSFRYKESPFAKTASDLMSPAVTIVSSSSSSSFSSSSSKSKPTDEFLISPTLSPPVFSPSALVLSPPLSTPPVFSPPPPEETKAKLVDGKTTKVIQALKSQSPEMTFRDSGAGATPIPSPVDAASLGTFPIHSPVGIESESGGTPMLMYVSFRTGKEKTPPGSLEQGNVAIKAQVKADPEHQQLSIEEIDSELRKLNLYLF